MTTAELHAEARDADDADLIAVFLSEERHGARRDRLLGRAHFGSDRRVLHNFLVDDPLDAIALVIGHGLKVHEVESQPVGGDERARLLDVRAEDLPERRVQKVSRRVVPACGISNRCIDFRRDEVPDLQ
jgi:hypothetical protein